MNDPDLSAQVPFLVARADPPANELEDHYEEMQPDGEHRNPEWFHTRCGHPRHRDD